MSAHTHEPYPEIPDGYTLVAPDEQLPIHGPENFAAENEAVRTIVLQASRIAGKQSAVEHAERHMESLTGVQPGPVTFEVIVDGEPMTVRFDRGHSGSIWHGHNFDTDVPSSYQYQEDRLMSQLNGGVEPDRGASKWNTKDYVDSILRRGSYYRNSNDFALLEMPDAPEANTYHLPLVIHANEIDLNDYQSYMTADRPSASAIFTGTVHTKSQYNYYNQLTGKYVEPDDAEALAKVKAVLDQVETQITVRAEATKQRLAEVLAAYPDDLAQMEAEYDPLNSQVTETNQQIKELEAQIETLRGGKQPAEERMKALRSRNQHYADLQALEAKL